MKKILSQVLVLAMIPVLLTGCGGVSKSAASYDMEAVVETTAASAVSEEGFASNSVSAALGGIGEVAALQQTERKLIRTVSLSVETDDFEALLNTLETEIAELSGYIEQSEVSGKRMNYDNLRNAYLTVRVPSTELDRFISSVDAIGNIVNKSESTNDVTLQYSDLESRKKTLTIEQERIWALLEKADTLEAVIALEERLSELRYELESMESRLRLYDNQVEYSTVQIDVREVKLYTPTDPESITERIKNGLARNVDNMKNFAENAFVAILVSIPIWGPAALLLLILLFAFRKKTAKKKIKNAVVHIPVSDDLEADQHKNEN